MANFEDDDPQSFGRKRIVFVFVFKHHLTLSTHHGLLQSHCHTIWMLQPKLCQLSTGIHVMDSLKLTKIHI